MLLTSFLNATEPVWPVDNVTLQAIHQRPMIENVKQSWISIHFARHFDSRPFESSSSKMRLLDPGRSHFLLSFCGSRTIWYVTGSAIVVVIYRWINVKSKFSAKRQNQSIRDNSLPYCFVVDMVGVVGFVVTSIDVSSSPFKYYRKHLV